MGKAAAVQSRRSATLQPRTATADRVVSSVCPYCAVGCAQHVYVRDEKVVHIEGNPDSPVSRGGRLCPKGAASLQLTTGEGRLHQVLYRPPHATDWQPLDLDTAMEMVVDRILATAMRPGRRRSTASAPRAPWASPAWAGRRWTTRRTTSSRSCSRRSGGWCRSRTRRGCATVPPLSGWAVRSAAAGGPPPSCRTFRTRTASSSKARISPSAIRSASNG